MTLYLLMVLEINLYYNMPTNQKARLPQGNDFPTAEYIGQIPRSRSSPRKGLCAIIVNIEATNATESSSSQGVVWLMNANAIIKK